MAWRIPDEGATWGYATELPDAASIAWSAQYGRSWEPLYAGDFLRLKTEIATLTAELAGARELLTEIRDGEVNAEDEADKYLRSHEKSELSKVRAAHEAARFNPVTVETQTTVQRISENS